jgi:hypothetical protein
MVIAHVAVYNQPGIDEGPAYHDGLEWHFYIDKGPGAPQDIITQLRDTQYQADSSYLANGFWKNGRFCGAISFESEGTGDDPWTDAQVDAIVWLFQEAHFLDGIPMQVCPAWDAQGFGYHRLFNEWNQPYHSCPGDQKVDQFNNVIMPRLLKPVTEPSEDDVALHIVSAKGGNGSWWLTDWITKRYINTPDEAANIVFSTVKTGGKIEHNGQNGPVEYPKDVVDWVPEVS